ncbi:MAG TPA: carboxypeptidase-like regulatory domain-containing protein [Flavobacteriales bacterium]|nr:carboxypeptidase-like regulatory domain-containing protein [Flavobacteriales bacterium]
MHPPSLRCATGLLLALLFQLPLAAQPPMATLTGQVVEARSLEPVPGASIWLLPGNVSLTATSDSAGNFRIAAIPVGHYTLWVAAVGHDTLEVPELWLRAGKQTVQRLELVPATRELGSVTVNAMAVERMDPLGVHTFTVEQSLRWAATFFDPGRMAGALPGVAVVNDEANHLSIRGNSPNANAWLLEGAEITSPNHTGNAATPSDLPTLTGGGVNMLSAQMLGTSRLLDGVLPMAYNNAVGGILDMRLRDGNRDRQEWTVQAGLLGLDLSTEGPLGADKRASFLANYRYSTVGLLSQMGVDLGDEDITYQDLSFNVALPLGKRGNLHVFGVGGTSSNLFKAVHDTATWEVDKDNRNIDYSSRIGVIGVRMAAPLGKGSSLRSVVAWSGSDQQRREERLRNDYNIGSSTNAELNERKLSGLVEVRGRMNGRMRYSTGVNVLLRELSATWHNAVHGPGSVPMSHWMQTDESVVVRPWANVGWSFTEHLEATFGAGLSWYDQADELVGEPRAQLQWRMRKGRSLALAAGIRSQLPQWQAMHSGPLRSRDVVLGYDHPFSEHTTLHVETYIQHLDRVPVAGMHLLIYDLPRFSVVNVWDEALLPGLEPAGTADNQGVEAGVERRFARGYFWQANGSLFNSTYSTPGHKDMDTRWNNRYIINLSGGKEFRKEKEDRVRTWGVSGRLYAMGGPREQSLSASPMPMDQLDQPWSVELAPFQRVDLRVYHRKDRKQHTGLWALDLQNVLGRRNEAFRYFDARQGRMMTKYQLGLIPNLSYRIEF